ncbi:MAG: proprotein convertase P-domain-containing protein [Myxococcales bacterium]|nr:proprotein convertase P-domain-containing protein [Myxococcales bacterium]
MFQVTLAAGETLRVRELQSGFDGVYHILATCAGGSACLASSDSSEATGLTYTAPTAGNYIVVVENWGSGSANVPFDIIIDKFVCGNGVLEGAEICDDGDTTGGDGCSATCTIETGFACDNFPAAPSNCFSVAGCSTATCFLGPCSGTVVTANPTNTLPAAIPDGASPALDLTFAVGATGTVQKATVFFNATHTWDSDLSISLAAPGQSLPGADLCSGNGSSGDNFTNTYLRDGVTTAITAGTAPFTGVYRPETALSTFAGQGVNGTWTMRVDDTATGDTGNVTGAQLAFCVTP